jgi:Uri superfamily endonuclease
MAQGGSYILVLEVERPVHRLQVGKFGCFDVAAGFYLYVGSAFGSGGLPARLAHHARREKPRMHWHVDYLRREAVLHEAWIAAGPERLECVWCRALAAHPALTIPIPRFGARDTGCAAHLFYTPKAPLCSDVAVLLGRSIERMPFD